MKYFKDVFADEDDSFAEEVEKAIDGAIDLVTIILVLVIICFFMTLWWVSALRKKEASQQQFVAAATVDAASVELTGAREVQVVTGTKLEYGHPV